MKNLLMTITFIFFTMFVAAQNLDIRLLDKLKEVSISQVDDYMINYYGFEKVGSKKDGSEKTYAKYYNHDLDNSIIITIYFSEEKLNSLEATLAKNFDLESIKKSLIQSGYYKQEAIDFEFYRFKKKQSLLFISQIPNALGQIKLKIISNS